MKVSEMVEPIPEIINEIKQAYNRTLKRCNEASKYLDSQETPQEEKEKHAIIFRIEIVDVLDAYIKVLQDWGVATTDNEMIGGFEIE